MHARHVGITISSAMLALTIGLLGPATALAQICGDPDGAGSITVSDGVQVLQAAAQLPSTCTVAVCDVDGSGVVSVTDGVLVLRRAANLPANLTCGTPVGNFVNNVESGGSQAVLEIGIAPLPGAGAPSTIGQVTGPQNVTPGESNTVDVPFDTAGGANAAQSEPPVFVLAIADLEGQFFDGFYVLPLDDQSGTATLTIGLPADLTEPFLLCPATQVNGVLSNYGVYRQDPITTDVGVKTLQIRFTLGQSMQVSMKSATTTQEVSS